MDTRTGRANFCVFERLRSSGLRPTRQRVALCNLLFGAGDRHLSAEELHEEAHRAGESVSLATVYNTLHQFTQAGLVRPISAEGQRTYFDTNTSDHQHFFVEGDNQIIDIPDGAIRINELPSAPDGMEIVNVDVVVRLRRKSASA
ncbi:iron response transcriptional regulator IrrA [Consotaella salsifontis]|uniref:Ferric uptake regulation protein n=1 Tax=Consotaella salsifontis TaxID=1365950 RepID=A0A1T4RR05_9HYPH|nr:Fur family transcriptional regulator [Consotaella salsifontis]SKA18071.1 Fur family transcriptional regulator, iron response regulator [Consotaella salsifontis]